MEHCPSRAHSSLALESLAPPTREAAFSLDCSLRWTVRTAGNRPASGLAAAAPRAPDAPALPAGPKAASTIAGSSVRQPAPVSGRASAAWEPVSSALRLDGWSQPPAACSRPACPYLTRCSGPARPQAHATPARLRALALER